MKSIKINNKNIGKNSPVFLIAEAGVNHNGKLNLAKKMINVAAKSKVDAIKFQTFKSESLMLKKTPKVSYQKKGTKMGENFYEMIKKFEFTEEQFLILKKYCDKKNLIFLSTPFDSDSVNLLNRLNIPAYKIGSGDMNNYPLLELICQIKKPILLSTGMATLEEVKQSVDFIKSKGISEIILFQCTTDYPSSFEEINLNVIDTYKKEFPGLIIGFSDHSIGFEASIGATAKGVKVIEKHFTLDRNLEGPDHKASMDPIELIEWVKSIKNLEKAMGSYIKNPSRSEQEIAQIARKSVVSAIDLKKGDELNRENITVKRPGSGIPPTGYYSLLGRKINRDIPKDTIIKYEDLN